MNRSNSDNSKDAWNHLWEELALMNDAIPGTAWRCGLLLALLDRYAANSDGPSRIIDFGCGPGSFLKKVSAARPGAQLLGLDQSDGGLGYARSELPSASFLAMDLTKSAEPPEDFRRWGTAGICSEVLEHVEDPVLFLKNIAPWLANEGILIITVPGQPYTAYTRHVGHLRHYTRESLRSLLEQAQYDAVHVWAAGFPFFNLYQLACLLRGEKLIEDANYAEGKGREGKGMSPLLRFASAVFRFLMKFNINATPLGWQIVAVAKKKA